MSHSVNQYNLLIFCPGDVKELINIKEIQYTITSRKYAEKTNGAIIVEC